MAAHPVDKPDKVDSRPTIFRFVEFVEFVVCLLKRARNRLYIMK